VQHFSPSESSLGVAGASHPADRDNIFKQLYALPNPMPALASIADLVGDPGISTACLSQNAESPATR
jgi:hypothetical protein